MIMPVPLVLFVSVVFSCLQGLILGQYFSPSPSSQLLTTSPISSPPVTKFDDRNSDEWRDFCRNFSMGDSITGEFTTPSYPNAYPANVECVRVIHAPVDYTILLDFRGSFFEVEKSNDAVHKSRSSTSLVAMERMLARDPHVACPFDYLEVRNGPYGFSPLIGRFCGDRFPPVIAADSGSMWLLFRTDNTIQYRGFKAVHYAAPKLVSPDTSKYRTHLCSFTVTMPEESTITIGTDEINQVYPDLFANRSQDSPIECVWKVETRSRAHMLRLQFDAFHLHFPNECNMNSMEIYAFTTSRSHLVKQFCGRIANYVDTRAYSAYVRIFLSEAAFVKTVIRASVVPYATGKNCNESMFACGDESCIPRALICNGQADCLSNLDERECSKGDRFLYNFFNSPYLVILIIIVLLIVFIVSCAIFVNVWHRIKKRRILYTPVKRSESSGILRTPSVEYSQHHTRNGATARKPLPPLQMSSSGGPLDLRPPMHMPLLPAAELSKPPLGSNRPIELVYSTHVPAPFTVLSPIHTNAGRLYELFPSLPSTTTNDDDLRLYMCRKGFYVNVETLRASDASNPRFPSPYWDRRLAPILPAPPPPAPLPPVLARSSSTRLAHSSTAGTLGAQLWSATPRRMHSSITAESSTVAYCSSQSTASGSVAWREIHDVAAANKRSKRKTAARPSKKSVGKLITTSKAYYQTRSLSSSSKHDGVGSQAPPPPVTHKFWSRMEDLITTTEDSSDATADCHRGERPHRRRDNNNSFEDNNDVGNLSDLTNRQSSTSSEESSEEDTECAEEIERRPSNHHDWILNEVDSILESETLRLETDSTELVMSL